MVLALVLALGPPGEGVRDQTRLLAYLSALLGGLGALMGGVLAVLIEGRRP